jgi:hypothetical protein
MINDEIRTRALRAFARRDKLQAELDKVNNELIKLKSDYMAETRIWGIRDESFRKELRAA